MRQCSLAVEHPLSKREVVGSNPAIGLFLQRKMGLWFLVAPFLYEMSNLFPSSQCSLAVERLLRKQKVAGSIPVVGFLFIFYG